MRVPKFWAQMQNGRWEMKTYINKHVLKTKRRAFTESAGSVKPQLAHVRSHQ